MIKGKEIKQALWNLMKIYIYIFWKSQKKKEKEKGIKSLLKAIMAENFPNLGREIDTQIHHAESILN